MLEYLQNLISWLPLIAIYYVALIPGKVYKANKDFKVNPNISIKLPPNLPRALSKEQKEEQVKENINRYLLNFSKVIEDKQPEENLKLYKNHKSDVKINESTTNMIIHILIRMRPSGGFYSLKNNSVNLFSFNIYEHETIKTGPYHELFHMASSYYDKQSKIMYCGFCQYQLITQFLGKSIGISINEGYTQTLAERYFNSNNSKQKISFTYELSKNISKLLEKIIGQDKMENLYMNANLTGLIDELSILNEKENSLAFIQNTDYVFKHYDESKYIPGTKKLILDKIKEIQVFLVNTYIEKKLIEMENNQITKEIFVSDASNFINDMQELFVIKKQNLYQFTREEILEIIKQKLPQEIGFEGKSK